MYTKEESREKIIELTESFEAKLDFIKTSKEYKEAQIEDEFIKPLFKYLNWNISNEGIINPHEREFIVQAQGRNRKEPDYLLQLENKRRFYIEAKHTKYDLQKRTDYIWQAYSYSYSTQTRPKYEKVDFALLTDFEEFRFFDCTFPVKNHETLNNYCVLDWTYMDYIKNFDKLWEYFERENVRNGSLDKLYISEKKIKENRITPDKAFLKDLDDEKSGWRIKLAKDVKKYHPEFSAEFITQTVQLILDRFIFIKVLVDREIEEDYIEKIVNKIKSIKDKEEGIIYEECKDIFEQLDKTYNGSIFTKRTELDVVRVRNKVLLDVLADFLPQNSRYNFKVIPIEILGTIYEQFLGKVVVTTAKQAKIDYKPEVRKAGGVYYTPDYIVDYIVEKTVGEKLHDCKKFSDLLEIKICDPACGSGSFLISAYNLLIQWTIRYYEGKIKTENGTSKLEKLTKDEKTLVYLDEDGNVRLTSKIKRDILKSCIYGVDIDLQAVEVTKMSLSLKALENTNHYEVYNERTLFHSTILPPLEGNIKCGNSLVGFDYYSNELILSQEEEKTIRPFEWNSEFKTIFDRGGFDFILGNPPYYNINILTKKYFKYLENVYNEIHTGYNDIMYYFIFKGIELLKQSGASGIITSNYYLGNSYAKKLRKFLKPFVQIILNFQNYHVFEDANIHTNIIISKKDSSNQLFYFNLNNQKKFNKENLETNFEKTMILKEKLEDEWMLSSNTQNSIIEKLYQNSINLGSISIIEKGSTSGKNEVFTVSKKFATENNFEEEIIRKNIKNSDIEKYNIKDRNYVLIYIDKNTNPKNYPNIYNYLKQHKKILSNRNEVSKGLYPWYRFERPRKKEVFDSKEKIVVPYRAEHNRFAFDNSQYFNDGGDIRTIVINDPNFNTKYILAILNSKLIDWFYGFIGKLKGKSREYFNEPLAKIPIKKTDDKKIKERLIQLVDAIMNSHKTYSKEISDIDKEAIIKKIRFFESQIDEIVYKLYELTSDEIKIIESEI